MLRRTVRLTLLLLASWTVFALTHECGHLLGGWACGGTLIDAELRPWRLPHSFFSPDPRPLVTLWCGPLVGVVVPLVMAAIIRRPPVWFVAWFCVLANGAYIATGWFTGDRELDTTKLLAAGAPVWSIALYVVATVVPGYRRFRQEWLRAWTGQSPREAPKTTEATADSSNCG
jgi:hypothetical protein